MDWCITGGVSYTLTKKLLNQYSLSLMEYRRKITGITSRPSTHALFKLISKLLVQASNGFPSSIHRGKGKKLSEQVYPCMFQLIFARVHYIQSGNGKGIGL